MHFGKKHIEVGKSSFGRTIRIKDENGETVMYIGLSFDEVNELIRDLK